uniref:Uncharacterized protein n=1 Tax=Alexandrium catenella TaxID=2925 RepID=A0A7S1R037_ALECA|mmetsp:Transcript_42087/g.113516  ORF Transcript_42087/g.113516 Transcript_42087/m.113516 type:complete len:144 (+) Transcript_42087:97-528(+)
MLSRAVAALTASLLLVPALAWDERDDLDDASVGELIAAEDLAAQFALSDLDGDPEALSLLQATALLHHKDRRDSAAAGHGLGPRDVPAPPAAPAGDAGRRAAMMADADDTTSETVALLQTEAKAKVQPKKKKAAKHGQKSVEL